MGALEIADLEIAYAGRPVVAGLSLTVAEGELFALLGPSGAGKTSILKAVAGLLAPRRGEIRIDGRSVRGLPPERRRAVMVFQKPLLFPFMDVRRNIGFGLRMQGVAPAAAERRIREIAALTGLAGFEGRRVHELSGGEQQRVALARALVLAPAVLLLDEPLSSLDANLRRQMRGLIAEIQAATRTTTLFVTHDQAEALTMAHRVGLLLGGRLRQAGTPRELFHRPADREVAEFFGGENFLEGRIVGGRFECGLGALPPPPPGVAANGRRLTATIRPEEIRLAPADRGAGLPLAGRVAAARFEGPLSRLTVDCGGTRLVVLAAGGAFREGEAVRLELPADKIHYFAPEAGAAPPRSLPWS